MWLEYYVAEQLHKTHGEVLDMPGGEFVHWVQYFALKAQRQELARKMA